jgi:predicted DsbA family dithiol-disulfide isomerase
VVWVEYNSDFLPKMEEELNRLRETYPGIRIGYRVYPVNNGCNKKVSASVNRFPWACLTATAAKAAWITGGDDGWRRYHEWLLQNGPGVQGEQSLVDGAVEVGLDPVLFQEALRGGEAEAMVAEDVQLGGQVRFRGPPAICINGRHVPRYSLEGHDILGTIVEAAAKGQ